MLQILIKNSIRKLAETILASMEEEYLTKYQIKQIINIYEMDFARAEQCILVAERTTWHAWSKI